MLSGLKLVLRLLLIVTIFGLGLVQAIKISPELGNRISEQVRVYREMHKPKKCAE